MKFQEQEVIEVVQGSSRIVIDPHGGRLLLWEHRGKQVIFWPKQADWSKPIKIRGGNPVLFPFIARHMVDGKVGFWKDETGLIREMPMHGFGREQVYQCGVNKNTCTLTLEDNDATKAYYPYNFRFQILYTIGEKSLEVSLNTTNLSETALPYYSGHHFYFAIPHTEREDWQFAVDSVQQVRQNAEGTIYSQTASTHPFNLADPDLIDSMHLLSGQGPVFLRNTLSNNSLAIHLNHPDSIPWYAVTSWTENTGSDFYCLEPWVGLPNAIHHGQGLRQLTPGKTEKAICRIELGQWE
jgi:galactose mutarotase-like enzyme